MNVRPLNWRFDDCCVHNFEHALAKSPADARVFLHDVKRMTFKLFLITIWSKNVTKWIPKWALNEPQNRPQNGPKLDLCVRPLPGRPGGHFAYKTNEKRPRRNL